MKGALVLALVAVLACATTVTATRTLPDQVSFKKHREALFERVRDAKNLVEGSHVHIAVHCFDADTTISWAIFHGEDVRVFDIGKPGQRPVMDDLTLNSVCCKNGTLPANAPDGFACVNGLAVREDSVPRLVGFGSSNVCEKYKGHTGVDVTYSNITRSGYYIALVTTCDEAQKFSGELAFRDRFGFLPASEYPFLLFYGILSLCYLAVGLVWMALCACHWKELLRLQLCILGVIFLGMMEMAIFYADYHHWNSEGIRSKGLMVFAVMVSCAKATLARLLVLVVSMGFGVVKPTLGSTMKRVLSLGVAFYVFDVIYWVTYALESVPDEPVNRKAVMVFLVPVSILDAMILWWTFLSLFHTIKLLTMRRQSIKLTMYRRFAFSLAVVAVVSMAFYMYFIWSNVTLRTTWHVKWLEYAYTHCVFFFLLVIIAVLWRPTSNNTRYAYEPLSADSDDEEEENVLVAGGAGENMKMRVMAGGSSAAAAEERRAEKRSTPEDDLAWVEANIPAGSGGLDILDLPTRAMLEDPDEIRDTILERSKLE